MEVGGKIYDFLGRHGMLPGEIRLDAATDAFYSAMRSGLSGSESSVRMLPAYLSAEAGPEMDASAAVIDAGGTNFRTALVTFRDSGARITRRESGAMPGSLGAVSWDEFIDYAARRLLPLLGEASHVGFCFSYPTDMTPALDGRLIRLTKQISITGFEGRLICADLSLRLAELGAGARRITLLNDTPAALLSGRAVGVSTGGLIGLICGTGVNTACELDSALIKKLPGLPPGRMIINLESGAFTGLPQGDFDRLLDAASADPGLSTYEKMVSGAYIGELCRLTLRGAAEEGLLGSGFVRLAPGALSSPDASTLAEGKIPPGFPTLPPGDTESASAICASLFDRAARCVTANLAAIFRLTGNGVYPTAPVRICADGSLIRHSAAFRRPLDSYVADFIGTALGRWLLMETPTDATIVGAAVAAFVNPQN